MIITSEDFLRQRSLEVSFEEGKEIVEKLKKELLKSNKGIGLSAPQIGVLKRVILIEDNKGFTEFINPTIIEKKDPFINKNEGCLSFPGVWLNTIRYHHIVVEDHFGKREFNNFASIILQHEHDHLNGILFFDRQVPDRYDECFCGSKKKFKFCCFSKVK